MKGQQGQWREACRPWRLVGLRLNSRVISGQLGKNAITVNHNEKPLTGLIDKAKAVGRGCGRWAEIRQT